MNHSFNVDIATKYGLEEAIILENIYFWITKNKANNQNLKDGKYWTYNSAKAFQTLFPYMKESKIYRVLKNLEEEKLILVKTYNANSYDHTRWYTLTEKGLKLFILPNLQNEKSNLQNEEIEFTKIENRIAQNEKSNLQNLEISITDINTDINTNINLTVSDETKPKKKNSKTPLFDYVREFTQDEKLIDILNKWLSFKLKSSRNFTLEQFKMQLENLSKFANGKTSTMIVKVASSYSAGYQALVYDNELEQQQPRPTYQRNNQTFIDSIGGDTGTRDYSTSAGEILPDGTVGF